MTYSAFQTKCLIVWVREYTREKGLVFVNVKGTQESIPTAYVALRAGTSNRVVVPARQVENRFLGSLKGLQNSD